MRKVVKLLVTVVVFLVKIIVCKISIIIKYYLSLLSLTYESSIKLTNKNDRF
jgi:hypothetical protein